jgi:hypothetical protein
MDKETLAKINGDVTRLKDIMQPFNDAVAQANKGFIELMRTVIVENCNMREKLDIILLDSKQFASILSEHTKAVMDRVYHNTRPNYLSIFISASPTIGRKRRNRRARGRKLAANRQKACA